jgi:hypothetical protein
MGSSFSAAEKSHAVHHYLSILFQLYSQDNDDVDYADIVIVACLYGPRVHRGRPIYKFDFDFHG